MYYILVFILASYLGYKFALYRVFQTLSEMNRQAKMSSGDKDDEQHFIPMLRTEKYRSILYLYENESDNFMCQGTDLEDLAHKLLIYKKVGLAIVSHGGQYFTFDNGRVKE